MTPTLPLSPAKEMIFYNSFQINSKKMFHYYFSNKLKNSKVVRYSSFKYFRYIQRFQKKKKKKKKIISYFF